MKDAMEEHWSEYVGRVVVITLRGEGTERMRELSALMREWGLRYRAVVREQERVIRSTEASLRVRMGELGCAVAHREAVELAAADGAESVLVLEDDVRMFEEVEMEGLRRALGAAMKEPGWEVLNLGGCAADWRPGTPAFGVGPGCEGWRQVRGMVATHAVIYHRRVYEKVMLAVPPREVAQENYTRLVKPRAFDEWLHLACTVWAPVRPFFYQTGEESAILAGGRHVIDVRAAIERTHERIRAAQVKEVGV